MSHAQTGEDPGRVFAGGFDEAKLAAGSGYPIGDPVTFHGAGDASGPRPRGGPSS